MPIETDDWRIERLSRSHDRSAFRSGKAPLDLFLRTLASQYEKRNLGRTFVLVGGDDLRVLGFYTLASGSASFEHLPGTAARKLPKHSVPVVLRAHLAVDLSARGQRLGERLLVDALRRSVDSARGLGIDTVEVHALDEAARDFYRKYGFVPLRDRDLHPYLPIRTISDSFDTPGNPSRTE